MAIKLEMGGGGKTLMAWPLVEELFFFAASLRKCKFLMGGEKLLGIFRYFLFIK